VGQFGFGQPVRRVEDARFLTGRGRFVDDLRTPGALHAVFVRSPHAHARIARLDADAARAMPGVHAVFTGAEIAAAQLGPLPCLVSLPGKGGTKQVNPPHPALPTDRVRHVGEAVAMVVAETATQARDAAEAVEVEWDALPAIVDLKAAIEPGAPQIWPEAPHNTALDWEIGDKAGVEAGFARAAHVTRLTLSNNRIVAAPMETRGAVGEFDAGTGRFTLHTGTQGGHKMRAKLAHDIFGLGEKAVRVVTPDVGGGFGMKIYLYPEQVLVLFAARALGRPVRWQAERAESFVSDAQARDQATEAELALDADGRFLAVRARTLANLGAYMSMYGAYIPTQAGHLIMPSVYRWPALHAEVRCVFTNTVPVDAYRGAGKPETNFIVERLIDLAARELKLDPAELRRRNMVPPSAMPFRTATKMVVDSGAFEANLDRALALADRAGFASRRAASEAKDKRRGLGLAAYMEDTVQRSEETATIRVAADGGVLVMVGTQSNGQGHETAYAQIVADRFGLDIRDVRVVQGDTDMVSHGQGTGGSRSLHAGGGAIHKAAEKVESKAKRIAAHLLEAAAADVRLADGAFVVVGTDRRVTFKDVAAAAFVPTKLPPEIEAGLEEIATYLPQAQSFPNGVHLCEVEVDPETGHVRLERYAIVDDFGRILNPLLVTGQVHGGVVQGIGQAIHEGCLYDAESGQILTGSLMDYGIPRADDLPFFDLEFNEVPCATNPLGVKGCGEAGAIVAPSTVINAIVDALAPLGVRHVEMPATPARVWRAIQDAKPRHE